MKSLTFTIGLMFMFIITTIAGRVEQTYHFGNPTIRQNGEYQRFELENTLLTAMPGQPVLPYQQVKLILPPGESALSIEILFSDAITLPGKFTIFPQQQVRPVSAGSSGIFIKDNTIYSRNASFPADPKGQLVTAFLNGHSVALTTFTPVSYNPVTGQLSYFTTAHVIVNTAPDSKAAFALNNLAFKSTEVLQMADNKEMEAAYSLKRLVPPIRYDLLIVSTTLFKSSFTAMQANYLREGITSKVVTLDSITTTMTGVDVPEKIRNFINQEYQTHGIQYVLLAGDDELIPHRGLYCYVQSGSGYSDSNIPSDLYYSALDGNWNTDGDALWGEPGEEDLLPDVAVGRMSFSDATELEQMLNKSFKYQFEPIQGEFRNILMAGESLWTIEPYITYGSDYLNLLRGEHSDNGYATYGIPVDYVFDTLYDEVKTWPKQELMDHLNLGRPMLNHSGHASQTYVMRLTNSDITNANFYGLNGIDHNFTIVYTHGCDCGAFDFNDCIAEKMVTINNFAVAFIGNSRYGWFNEGQTEGPSQHLHREFMDALYADSLNRIGRAHMESKIASAAWVTAPGQWEPGALRWVFYDCNLLGDPALAVFTDNPIVITTEYPDKVALGTTSLNVSVSTSGLPAAGLTCVVMKDGILIGKSATDKSGNAVVNFDIIPQYPGEAQLIVSGYNCVPVTYSFNVVDYTGISNLTSDQSNMTISPNPANARITIGARLTARCDYTIKVYTIDGKLTLPTINSNADISGLISENLDISSLKPGHYTCEIMSVKHRISKPFIVY
ncbi:MAG: C25 family cysteine peptidase [Bacteroidales bacterium]|nr:C25 family cysteine peptidase [Bacteroidales bacterium]